MSPAPRLAVALQVDDGRPIDALLALLDEDDRPAAAAHAGRRRRHFALGRLAAARARSRLPGSRCQQAPGISIAHSGLLAAACAWTADAGALVGLDLERVRAFDVAATHAFTPRERRVLRGAGGDAMAAGIAGWVAKEAAFKALRLPAEAGPEAVELREMDGKRGWARVVGRRRGVRGAAFLVRLRRITRPDGVYVLGLARGEGRS
jgi:4'-phosphopantetheinyl transferase EntD